jgi:hypothetical protein
MGQSVPSLHRGLVILTPYSILPSGPDWDAVPGCGLLEAPQLAASVTPWQRQRGGDGIAATDVRLPLASFTDVLVSLFLPVWRYWPVSTLSGLI